MDLSSKSIPDSPATSLHDIIKALLDLKESYDPKKCEEDCERRASSLLTIMRNVSTAPFEIISKCPNFPSILNEFNESELLLHSAFESYLMHSHQARMCLTGFIAMILTIFEKHSAETKALSEERKESFLQTYGDITTDTTGYLASILTLTLEIIEKTSVEQQKSAQMVINAPFAMFESEQQYKQIQSRVAFFMNRYHSFCQSTDCAEKPFSEKHAYAISKDSKKPLCKKCFEDEIKRQEGAFILK
jgi:hypothetical protein